MKSIYDEFPDSEIRTDILDTLYEIQNMTREATAFKLLGDRLSMMKASARRDGIIERQSFIKKLETILDARSTKPSEGNEK